MRSRAFSVAGESAHRTHARFDEALRHHECAERHALNADDARQAIWGQLLAVHEVEKDFSPLLERYSALRNGDADVELRLAIAKLLLAECIGGLSAAAEGVFREEPLLTRARDPLVRSLYLYRAAYALVQLARYEEALLMALRARAEVDSSRLAFANSHVLGVTAAAHLGLRQLHRADVAIDSCEAAAKDTGTTDEVTNVQTLRARWWITKGEPAKAFDTLQDHFNSNIPRTPSIRGEFAALSAICLAAMGESRAAELARHALSTTKNVEARTLSGFASAIYLARTGNAFQAELQIAMSLAEAEGHMDSLVIAYRAYPPIFDALHQGSSKTLVSGLLRASNDERLARKYGFPISVPEGRGAEKLTPREREVYDFLCLGLTNKEIAIRLTISPTTVKLHVRHIFAKLNVKTRTQAVVAASRPTD